MKLSDIEEIIDAADRDERIKAIKLLRAGRKERTGHEELDFDALEDGGDDE